jgi:hypothetical protein
MAEWGLAPTTCIRESILLEASGDLIAFDRIDLSGDRAVRMSIRADAEWHIMFRCKARSNSAPG